MTRLAILLELVASYWAIAVIPAEINAVAIPVLG